MAIIISPKKLDKIKKENDDLIASKKKEYEAKGKIFNYDPYGSGIMPQAEFERRRS